VPGTIEPKAGEIWNVNFDPQFGREQGGIRPALVISNDAFNAIRNGLIFVIPLTGTFRGITSHVRIEAGVGGLTKTSFALCEQAKSQSVDRFIDRRGIVPPEVLLTVRRIAVRFIDAHLIYR
jgi:mRNA interferase MazF